MSAEKSKAPSFEMEIKIRAKTGSDGGTLKKKKKY